SVAVNFDFIIHHPLPFNYRLASDG
ncbi:MAG: hypothetical protein ACJASX_004133, partial [Limisphaerales bacterium]